MPFKIIYFEKSFLKLIIIIYICIISVRYLSIKIFYLESKLLYILILLIKYSCIIFIKKKNPFSVPTTTTNTKGSIATTSSAVNIKNSSKTDLTSATTTSAIDRNTKAKSVATVRPTVQQNLTQATTSTKAIPIHSVCRRTGCDCITHCILYIFLFFFSE